MADGFVALRHMKGNTVPFCLATELGERHPRGSVREIRDQRSLVRV